MACTFVECESSLRARGLNPRTYEPPNFEPKNPPKFSDAETFRAWYTKDLDRRVPAEQHRRARDQGMKTIFTTKFHLDGSDCSMAKHWTKFPELESGRVSLANRTTRYHMSVPSDRMISLKSRRGPQRIRSAKISVHYADLSKLLDMRQLKGHLLAIDTSVPVRLLPGILRDLLIDRLRSPANDQNRQTIVNQSEFLSLEFAIKAPSTAGSYARIDHDFNVDLLVDLLAKPANTAGQLDLGIVMTFKQDKAVESANIDDHIKIQESHDWRVYRIGEYVEKPWAPATEESDAVPLCWPLFAWWHSEHGTEGDAGGDTDTGAVEDLNVELYTVPGYNSGEVGLIAHHLNRNNYFKVSTPRRHKYSGPLAGLRPNSWKIVSDEVRRAYKEAEPQELGNGHNEMPFLPPYCFNSNNSAIWTETGAAPAEGLPGNTEIHIAVRAIPHISMPPAWKSWNDGPSMLLPYDIRFEARLDANAEEIGQKIELVLRKPDRRARYTPDALYHDSEKGRRKNWDMELWVLPQAPAHLKMWCFGDDDDGDSPDLNHFVNRDFITEQGKRHTLYMEAHIFPKEGDDSLGGNRTTVGNALEIDKANMLDANEVDERAGDEGDEAAGQQAAAPTTQTPGSGDRRQEVGRVGEGNSTRERSAAMLENHGSPSPQRRRTSSLPPTPQHQPARSHDINDGGADDDDDEYPRAPPAAPSLKRRDFHHEPIARNQHEVYSPYTIVQRPPGDRDEGGEESRSSSSSSQIVSENPSSPSKRRRLAQNTTTRGENSNRPRGSGDHRAPEGDERRLHAPERRDGFGDGMGVGGKHA